METPDPSPGPGLLEPSPEVEEEDLAVDGAGSGTGRDDGPAGRTAAPEVEDEDHDGEPAPAEDETAAAAPSVVAVLVTSDPGPWLEEALASLAAQEYPALSVLVLDNGSAEDPTPRIAEAMPRAFVRRLESNLGFAAAANDAMRAVEGATFLLFCHDDVALGPDAVGVMVEEAYRSNAGIVGPKFVDYEHPEILLEVGMAVDHYGVPFSAIEPGEVDQEQHDAVRDVFYVSDAAMLVRADLFHELGGFDPGTFPGSDDLDLCWRARLAGARVLVAPDARVRHRRATVQDERPSRRNEVGDLRAFTKSRVRVLTKSYSPVALVWVLPTAFLLNSAEALALVLTRRPGRARALLAGWFAAFGRGSDIRQARASTQELRRVDDADVRDLMVRGSARVRTFLTQRLHAGDRLAQVSNRTRLAVSEAGTRLRALPAVAAVTLAVLVAIGSRHLVLDRIPEVGSMQDWPGIGALWATFTSPWRYAMMGAESAAAPAFGLMTVLGTLLLGDTDLARTLVVAGALPLGTYGAYRLARPLARAPLPAVATAIAYAVNPIVRNAIAEGELGPLVCFALAPFVLRSLMVVASTLDTRARHHAIVTIALLVLVAAAAWPPAVLLAAFLAFGIVAALPLVGGRGATLRVAVTAGFGTLVAAVLLLPWLSTLFGADAATLGFLPQAPLDVTAVVTFDTGSASAGVAPFGLLVAASLPLVVATGARLAWAGRAWVLALLSFLAAWLPSRLEPSAAVPAAEGVLVPAALAIALAVGLGVAAFVEDLRSFHFGWRQFAAVAAAVGLALPIVAFAAASVSGRWGMPTHDWPSSFAWMDEERTNGDFRVLWIGDPNVLPTGVKVVDDVGYGITRQGAGDARALWAPPEGDADRILAEAIAAAHAQQTVRLGHLVAPAGVRYITYVQREAPDAGARGRRDPALEASLPAQLDLTVSRVEPGATVYENAAWIPARAIVPPETEVPFDSDDPLAAASRAQLPGTVPVTGPQESSDPTGPGTLLWAEAADSGWQATTDGAEAPRRDAFGWTNAFTLTSDASVDLSFSGGAARYLVYLQLLLWLGALVLWWRIRPAHKPRRVPEATS
jgi:GT2 family glycosyltransferase